MHVAEGNYKCILHIYIHKLKTQILFHNSKNQLQRTEDFNL